VSFLACAKCSIFQALATGCKSASYSEYRDYFGKDGDTLIILLGGGTKIRKVSKIPIPVKRALHKLGHDMCYGLGANSTANAKRHLKTCWGREMATSQMMGKN
jgi:hypothetical protein